MYFLAQIVKRNASQCITVNMKLLGSTLCTICIDSTSLLERLPGAPDLFDVRENAGFLH